MQTFQIVSCSVALLLADNFSVMVFSSLTLGSVDRALHSAGARSGYVVVNGSSLQNPVDTLLLFAQVK